MSRDSKLQLLRRLFTLGNKKIKIRDQILYLLEAVWHTHTHSCCDSGALAHTGPRMSESEKLTGGTDNQSGVLCAIKPCSPLPTTPNEGMFHTPHSPILSHISQKKRQ